MTLELPVRRQVLGRDLGARNHRALWILHYAGNRPRNDSLGNGERGAEDDYSESYKADKPGAELVSHAGSPDKDLT